MGRSSFVIVGIVGTAAGCVVAHSTPGSGDVVNGDVVIRTQADVDALAGVTAVNGRVTIDSTTLTSVTLPALASVGGFMCAEDGTAPCTLTTLSLPALRTVANAIAVDDFHLTTFDLPMLREATYVFLSNMDQVSLPSLQVCSQGAFSFTPNSQPTAISLPMLTTCDLVMEWTGPTLELPSFTAGRLQMEGGTTPVLSLPSMTSGDLEISDTTIGSIEVPVLASGSVMLTGDDAMTTIDLGALKSGSLAFDDNKKLASVTVAADAAISQLIVVSNASFPTCAALALWEALGRPPGQISNNDSSATCP